MARRHQDETLSYILHESVRCLLTSVLCSQRLWWNRFKLNGYQSTIIQQYATSLWLAQQGWNRGLCRVWLLDGLCSRQKRNRPSSSYLGMNNIVTHNIEDACSLHYALSLNIMQNIHSQNIEEYLRVSPHTLDMLCSEKQPSTDRNITLEENIV